MTGRPPGARTIDEILAGVRARLLRLTPEEALCEQAEGAVLSAWRTWSRSRTAEAVVSWRGSWPTEARQLRAAAWITAGRPS